MRDLRPPLPTSTRPPAASLLLRGSLLLALLFFSASCARPRTRAEWQAWWQAHRATCAALEPRLRAASSREALWSDPQARALVEKLGPTFVLRLSDGGFKFGQGGRGLAVAGWGQSVVWKPLGRASDDGDYDQLIAARRRAAYLRLAGNWYVEYVAH